MGLVILLSSTACSLLNNSLNSTSGPNSPLTIIGGDAKDVNIINQEDKFIYEPKDNRKYEEYFIDKSIHYHSKIYHQTKVEIRELEEEKVILKKDLNEGKIGKKEYNNKVKEIDEEIGNKNRLLPKIDNAYKTWNGDTTTDATPQIIHSYMLQIASVQNVKEVCNYNDSFDYENIEFVQTANGYYKVQIGPYSQNEVDRIMEELQPKYGNVKKVAR
jgi:hypothetical protein